MNATQILKSLNTDDNTGIATEIDLKTSTLKPLYANCVINNHHLMSQRPELLQ